MIKRKVNLQQQIDSVNFAVAQAQASAQSAVAVAQGQATARPNSKASFLIDGANSRFIDPRISFARNSIGTYVDKFGVLRTTKANQPRFHHDPVTKECLGVLMETSKTNLFNYSNDFTNGQYVKNQTSIVASTVQAPDLSNAYKLVEDGSNNDHNMNRSGITITAGKRYTASIFVKAAERTRVNIALANSSIWGGSNPSAIFDLETGTLVSSSNVAKTPKIETYPNGWYRIQVTQAATLTGSSGINIQLIAAGTSVNYQGNGTSGIYIFGEQFENGSRASSYIPTGVSTVNRADDLIEMVGTTFTELFPFLSEGSIFISAQKGFAEENTYPSFFGFFGYNTTNGQNAIRLTNLLTDTTFTASIYSDGTSNSTIYTVPESSDISTTLTWKQGNIKSFCGSQVGNTFNGNIPNNLYTAQIQGFNGCLKQVAFWNRQLTDAEAQNLSNSGLAGKRNNQVPAISDLGALAFLSPYAILRSSSRQHFTLDANGASQIRNLRFPFDFTFEIVDSSGFSITSQPSGTCLANTDNPLVVNGTVGKSLSYAITPVYEY